jgi:hypothetical protein
MHPESSKASSTLPRTIRLSMNGFLVRALWDIEYKLDEKGD